MRKIKLDAIDWAGPRDFYDAVLPLLGAPEGHGVNVNALIDSTIWGGMNAVDPPYQIEVRNTRRAPVGVLNHLVVVRRALARARQDFRDREGHDVEVSLRLLN